MKRAIIKSKDKKQYFFYDNPQIGVDYKKEEIEGFLELDNEVGFHSCNKSGLYDDLEGYTDKIQNEEKLEEQRRYIVTYLKLCENANGLEQLVDYDISKSEILNNVISQKYTEGADYFFANQFER